MLSLTATPWKLKAPALGGARGPPQRPQRSITLADIVKYGTTPGCLKCAENGASHTDVCKSRFETVFQREAEEKAAAAAAKAAARPPAPLPRAIPLREAASMLADLRAPWTGSSGNRVMAVTEMPSRQRRPRASRRRKRRRALRTFFFEAVDEGAQQPADVAAFLKV